MPPLGAVSQAWTSAEASLPLGWQLRGLYRFDDLWVCLAEGPRSMTTPAAQGGAPRSRHPPSGPITESGMHTKSPSEVEPVYNRRIGI